ncbi:MAG: DUF4160 domain-containing protein [Acidibrevibacterium sp.]|nr:DUF4160 domain-containing protein [Acidibrevibacterium fodinaquatile]
MIHEGACPRPNSPTACGRSSSPCSLRRARVFFYANEGNPRESVHVHVRAGGREAKFWLTPEIRIAYSDGFDARTQRVLVAMIEANRNLIMRKWDEFFA